MNRNHTQHEKMPQEEMKHGEHGREYKDHEGRKEHQHHDHHGIMMRDYWNRFWVSAILTVPVLALSSTIQSFLGFSLKFSGDIYVSALLASIIYFFGGWPFFKGIFEELKKLQPGMMTLISLAISVAYFYSLAIILGLTGEVFFWELATLIDVMLLGHYLEMKSVLGASQALEKLAQLLPATAHQIVNGQIKEISQNEIVKGHFLLVKAGEKIPADAIIKKGQSTIDESMLTGESIPVSKKIGDKVIAGSINGEGVLEVEVTGTGAQSYLNKVIDLVKQAQGAKSRTQALADKAAFWLTIIAITVGLATFFYWYSVEENLAFAIGRMATVMVIACPHALGLAIPLVVAISTAVSAKNGLLIRNRTAFENSRKISTIVFDKTGTLTKGKMAITDISVIEIPNNKSQITNNSKIRNSKFETNYKSEIINHKSQILQLAASLEKNSEHPIAKAIVEKAKTEKIELLEISGFKVLKGEGVETKINKDKVSLLSLKALQDRKIALPKDATLDQAATFVMVLINDQLAGIISLEDEIRPESYQAIETLKNSGIKCWMLTGDNEKIAQKVSEELKLDGFFAQVLPHQKLEKIEELQTKGEFVAMTGDGINDAPALAQADIGIAVGSGTDIAAETADIILVRSNPQDISNLILFGKATYNKMVQNLFWATGYNIVAIPLAAGVLHNYGLDISPAIGAALMSASTIIVAINAKLLRLKTY